MSKEAEILWKCVSCHSEYMCQKSRKSRGSCTSGVSVLQKVTLEVNSDVAAHRLGPRTKIKVIFWLKKLNDDNIIYLKDPN